jgi:hypothetical protein
MQFLVGRARLEWIRIRTHEEALNEFHASYNLHPVAGPLGFSALYWFNCSLSQANVERHASFILPSNMYSTEDWYIQAPVSAVSLQRFPFITFTLKAVVFSCEVRMSEDQICLIRA